MGKDKKLKIVSEENALKVQAYELACEAVGDPTTEKVVNKLKTTKKDGDTIVFKHHEGNQNLQFLYTLARVLLKNLDDVARRGSILQTFRANHSEFNMATSKLEKSIRNIYADKISGIENLESSLLLAGYVKSRD